MIQDKKPSYPPFPIVCYKAYEFEGTIFKIGDIGYHSHGRNIPNNWRKATRVDIEKYQNRKR